MKIIDMHNRPQEIPFSLGEAGRGRWLEEIRISNRPGQEPTGPEDVGYFLFGEEKRHCILIKANPSQQGVLVRINTYGTYTRGSDGSVAHKGGEAKMLVAGAYAFGDAGRICGGSDELWHVESPTVFVVNICGGSHKGYGHRYLVVTRSFNAVLVTREELCQMIATDEDPEVTEVVRQFADQLHKDVQSAIKIAEQLEEAMDHPEKIAVPVHFTKCKTIEEVVRGWGIAIPVAMAGKVAGVSGVQASTLIPGAKSLASFRIGPGGGKRYRFKKVSESGLARIRESGERPWNSESVLALVDSPDWHSAWVEYKDGEITSYVLANAGGIHHYIRWVANGISTEPWDNVPVVTPTKAEIEKIFGLSDIQDKEEPVSLAEGFKNAGFIMKKV
jgi:hypothetical protein